MSANPAGGSVARRDRSNYATFSRDNGSEENTVVSFERRKLASYGRVVDQKRVWPKHSRAPPVSRTPPDRYVAGREAKSDGDGLFFLKQLLRHEY